MKSLSYEQYNWVELNRRMVKNKFKQDSNIYSIYYGLNSILSFPVISIRGNYGAKQYAEIWCQTICSHFPQLPYKEIVWYFFELVQWIQIYRDIKCIKEQIFKFLLTLHMFYDVDTSMYILLLINII